MSMIRLSSPHAHSQVSTAGIMRQVLLACLPGILTLSWFFGIGILLNLFLACLSALAAEALVMKLRNRPLTSLTDYSALVTGVLLGVCLPATAPWWIPVVGGFFALLVGKQLFGGLGQNPFNPAMAAYAFLLISFPVQMSIWPLPISATDVSWLNSGSADALTGATALDAWRNKGLLMADEFWQDNQRLNPAMLQATSSIALAWLLGGLYLIARRIIQWQLPAAFIGTLLIYGAFVWGLDTSHYAPPWLHLAAGSAVFAAFFILTDPVSGATSMKGKILFGIGAGLLVISIRTWGSYPDGVAFSILLMNFAAPALDYFTRPRVYGHTKARSGMKTGKNHD
ncbi:MAG: RnfABCDGE type electron transport complex subunit D [Marinospirillum sp.]|uniref:RnfABCDGE type electron transport complex subunit D n=1 Tax=Marinospirillum sp. TaxID=2183934 RepID=UPI0019FC0292|nr:RnfABCDGE type electron transport complex subunit D [Marinospirillum sp.]MBE0505592.1 RnfABCDGE type electron transport complex subunit D [Marinospirillum sp.]